MFLPWVLRWRRLGEGVRGGEDGTRVGGLEGSAKEWSGTPVWGFWRGDFWFSKIIVEVWRGGGRTAVSVVVKDIVDRGYIGDDCARRAGCLHVLDFGLKAAAPLEADRDFFCRLNAWIGGSLPEGIIDLGAPPVIVGEVRGDEC